MLWILFQQIPEFVWICPLLTWQIPRICLVFASHLDFDSLCNSRNFLFPFINIYSFYKYKFHQIPFINANSQIQVPFVNTSSFHKYNFPFIMEVPFRSSSSGRSSSSSSSSSSSGRSSSGRSSSSSSSSSSSRSSSSSSSTSITGHNFKTDFFSGFHRARLRWCTTFRTASPKLCLWPSPQEQAGSSSSKWKPKVKAKGDKRPSQALDWAAGRIWGRRRCFSAIPQSGL